MTTKTISGTYSSGYFLSTNFDAVSITASGSVGGVGLLTSAFTSVTNSGHLEASLGNDGVILGGGGGSLANAGSGYIRGGAAKAASGAGADGNTGGAGAYLTVYASITDTLGDIVGGAGGAGVAGTLGGGGGTGGAGARFHDGGYVRNQGLIRGGLGGTGGATRAYNGGDGGLGGDGVSMTAAGTVVNYSGHIYGGAGGHAGAGASARYSGGFGGAGVYLAEGGYVDVYQGLVQGGVGGYGGANGGGRGGAGVVLSGASGTVVNSGAITGGAGGAGGGNRGGAGVYLNAGGLLVNEGSVRGGSGGSAVNGSGGNGGFGVFCPAGGTIDNYGTIITGVGGTGTIDGQPTVGVYLYGGGGIITNGSSRDTNAFIGTDTTGVTGGEFGDGIFAGFSAVSPVTVTNFGTIEGGSSPEAYAVFFHPAPAPGNAPTLVVEAGCAFIGAVYGGGMGELVLASGVGTVGVYDSSSSDNLAIVSGSMATTNFTSFATLEIGDGASFTLAAGSDVSLPNGTEAANTLVVDGTATIAATLSVEGTIDVSGKLTGAKNSALIIDGGTANFSRGASLSAPTVDVSGAAQVNVGVNLAFAHTWDQTGGTLSVDNGATFTFKGSGSTFSGLLTGSGGIGKIALAPTAPGTDSLNGVTISELTVDVSGAALAVGAAGATVASTGTVRFDGSSPGYLGGLDTLTNAGVIETASSAGATIVETIVNTGVLYADGGNLTMDGAVTGAGSAKITAATLDFASSFTGNVTFAGGSGELVLADSQGYTGTITGFSKTGGTSLDLGDIRFVSSTEATYSGTKTGGVLTVTDGMHTARISLKGNYLTSTFIASKDGGGVLITDPAGGGGAAQPPPHAFIAAMAAFGARPGAGVASHAMTGPRDMAATLLTPRVATA